MRGYLSCQRCGWSRIYARVSIARLPQFCPQCGRRVVRERNPSESSPAVAHWRAVADDLLRHGSSHTH
ncbi:MAG: hypothetical protein QOJ57_1222 [Thermoleophilaceae bacterium]|nr:hypothetical protein [Thermoleophilaceae bacterium]